MTLALLRTAMMPVRSYVPTKPLFGTTFLGRTLSCGPTKFRASMPLVNPSFSQPTYQTPSPLCGRQVSTTPSFAMDLKNGINKSCDLIFTVAHGSQHGSVKTISFSAGEEKMKVMGFVYGQLDIPHIPAKVDKLFVDLFFCEGYDSFTFTKGSYTYTINLRGHAEVIFANAQKTISNNPSHQGHISKGDSTRVIKPLSGTAGREILPSLFLHSSFQSCERRPINPELPVERFEKRRPAVESRQESSQ